MTQRDGKPLKPAKVPNAKGRGKRNDAACQLCYKEPWVVSIELSRVGEKCFARLRAIALNSGIRLVRRGRTVMTRKIGDAA